MRNFLVILLVSAGLLWAAGPAAAQEGDLSGEWTLTMEGESPSGLESVTLRFEREGHRLVARMQGESDTVDCQGWVDGNRIRFYYIRPTEAGEFIAKYTGHFAGDLMGGEVDMGELGKTKWRATRGAQGGIDLSGQWTMVMEGESPSGEQAVKLSFQQQGSQLMVLMSGESGEVECEGFIEGNALRFYYIRAGEGADFVARFTGHVGGDVMGGEVDMGERGKTNWKATRDS